MLALANLIGELGGDSWTTQSAALVVAAFLALIAAVVTALVTARQGRLNRINVIRVAVRGHLEERKLKGRQDWWVQFAWAAERLYGTDEGASEVAATVLNRLEQVPWASQEERDLVTDVLSRLNSDITDEDIQEVRDVQDNQS